MTIFNGLKLQNRIMHIVGLRHDRHNIRHNWHGVRHDRHRSNHDGQTCVLTDTEEAMTDKTYVLTDTADVDAGATPVASPQSQRMS